ncbi:MAG: LamG domain-containing protein, partial [Bacteroidota bacterium]
MTKQPVACSFSSLVSFFLLISGVLTTFVANAQCVSEQTVTTNLSTSECPTKAAVYVSSSEAGVNYTLRNQADHSVIAGPIAGNGSKLSFIISIPVTTTYEIFAENTVSACSAVLVSTATVTITNPIIDQPLSAGSICRPGSSNVTTASSQTGLNYWLRDNTTNAVLDGPIAGTGGPLQFNTGTIATSKTFNVLASSAQTPTAGAAGAMSFSTSFVSLPPSFDSYFNNKNKITVEAWVMRTDSGLLQGVVSSYLFARMEYLLRIDNHKATFSVSPGNGSAFFKQCPGTSNIPLNTWTHLAGTWDGTTVRVFVNGVQENEIPASGVFFNTANGPRIGLSGDNEYFSGRIADVRIWSITRTQQEIAANMSTCFGPGTTGLLALYQMTNGVGSTSLSDNSGNGYNSNGFGGSPAWVEGPGGYTCDCSFVMSSKPTITATLFDQQVTASRNGVCSGTSSDILVASTQTGVNYKLYNSTTNQQTGPTVAGTGSGIAFLTGALNQNTSFYVVAEKAADTTCNLVLTQKPAITIGLFQPAVTTTDTVIHCVQAVRVTLDSSAVNDQYYVLNESDSVLSGPFAGTGSTLSFNTPAFSGSTAFHVIAADGVLASANCRVKLGSTVNVSYVPLISTYTITNTGETSGACATPVINISGSQQGVNYYVTNGTNAYFGPVKGTGEAISIRPSVTTNATLGVRAIAAHDANMSFAASGTSYLNNTNMNLFATSMTFDFWAKRNATTGVQYMFGYGNASSELAVYWLNNTTLRIITPSGATFNATVTGGTNWRHYAICYNYTTRVFTVYLDGQLAITATALTAAWAVSVSAILRIGSDPAGNGYFRSGEIDDLKVWRTALSTEQINKSRKGELTGVENVLEASYDMNEGFGSQVVDNTNHGHNLAFVNAGTNWIDPLGLPCNTALSAAVTVNGAVLIVPTFQVPTVYCIPTTTGSVNITNNTVSGASYSIIAALDYSPLGAPVPGTGSTLSVNNLSVSATTLIRPMVTKNGCTAYSQTVGTMTVRISDQQVNAADTAIYTNDSTAITLAASQNGVVYTLRRDADSSVVGASQTGTTALAPLSFPTGPLTATTKFHIYAVNSCDAILPNRPTVTVIAAPVVAFRISNVQPITSTGVGDSTVTIGLNAGGPNQVFAFNSVSGTIDFGRFVKSGVSVTPNFTSGSFTHSISNGILTYSATNVSGFDGDGVFLTIVVKPNIAESSIDQCYTPSILTSNWITTLNVPASVTSDFSANCLTGLA